jgi:deoxycytidylate deaminase
VTCAKKKVTATLTTRDGSIYHGENICQKPQAECPRVGDEGYEKCASVCMQPMHAELHAITQAIMAGKDVEGGHMVVRHTRVCSDCARDMTRFKITWETSDGPVKPRKTVDKHYYIIKP